MAYGVGILSQVMITPGAEYLECLKDIAGYMKGACDKVIAVKRSNTTTHTLTGYTDSDFAGCHETRRSRSGNCRFYKNNLIGSSSKVYTAEAEFVAMTQAITFCVWAMSLLTELGFEVEKPSALNYKSL